MHVPPPSSEERQSARRKQWRKRSFQTTRLSFKRPVAFRPRLTTGLAFSDKNLISTLEVSQFFQMSRKILQIRKSASEREQVASSPSPRPSPAGRGSCCRTAPVPSPVISTRGRNPLSQRGKIPHCVRNDNRSAKIKRSDFLQRPGLSQANRGEEAAGINPAPTKNRFA